MPYLASGKKEYHVPVHLCSRTPVKPNSRAMHSAGVWAGLLLPLRENGVVTGIHPGQRKSAAEGIFT